MNRPIASLKDQLAPIARDMRQTQPEIRWISQVTGELAGADAAMSAASARTEVLRWVNNRFPRIPEEAWGGAAFDEELLGQAASAFKLDLGRGYWAARLDHPDPTVPGRVWSTEIAIALPSEGAARFGVRLICASRADNAPAQRTVPGLVRQVIETPGLLIDGRPVREAPWVIESDEEADSLTAYLFDPRRSVPVLVVTLIEDEDDDAQVAVDAKALAISLVGVGVVAVVPAQLTYNLTRALGRDFSVFNGSARSYMPGLDVLRDPWTRHPLALRESILHMREAGTAFEAKVVESFCQFSIRNGVAENTLPAYRRVRTMYLQRRAERARGTEDKTAALAAEIEGLRVENEELTDLANTEALEKVALQGERDSLLEEINRLKAERFNLQSFNESLQAALKVAGEPSKEVLIPDSLDDLGDWAAEYFPGQLTFHPRALRGAKSAAYDDIPLVYRALMLLAQEYRDQRLDASPEQRNAFIDRLNALELECVPSITPEQAGRFDSEYKIQWRGGKRLLDMHLKKGTSREPRLSLRIYFFWDDDDKSCVVGWLPSHLTNQLS
jgi:hypothetical protein